jgi:hypothetical protein
MNAILIGLSLLSATLLAIAAWHLRRAAHIRTAFDPWSRTESRTTTSMTSGSGQSVPTGFLLVKPDILCEACQKRSWEKLAVLQQDQGTHHAPA